MNETTLEQIYDKISVFINKLISQLSSDAETIISLPIEQLDQLIIQNFKSASEYRNPTQSFKNSINITMALINTCIESKNINSCISLLELLDSQLKSFTKLETSWVYTIEYNNLFHEFEQYSKKQYENQILSTQSHSKLEGKGVIYTAITGNYDNLNPPQYIDNSLDYICFTDNASLKSDFWNIHYIKNDESLDPTRLARKCKILCTRYLSEYDYSIWIDGKIRVINDLKTLWYMYHRESPILCFPHYCRDCIYEESEVCINLSKGNATDIKKQISKYKGEQYPEHNGLIDSCVLFRDHHDSELIEIMNNWWDEITNESTRDQISFPYICWKNDFKYDLCNLSIYNNSYFNIEDHNK